MNIHCLTHIKNRGKTMRNNVLALSSLVQSVNHELGRPEVAIVTMVNEEGKKQHKWSKGTFILERGSKENGLAWKVCEILNSDGGRAIILAAATSSGLLASLEAYHLGILEGKIYIDSLILEKM